MKFAEAKLRIGEIVGGDYFAMAYHLTVPEIGTEVPKCSVFTIGTPTETEHGYGTKDYPDWEGVIGDLVAYKTGKTATIPVSVREEAPE